MEDEKAIINCIYITYSVDAFIKFKKKNLEGKMIVLLYFYK